MSSVLALDIIAWIFTFCGWGLNYSNRNNYTDIKNKAAIFCFGTALVLFIIALLMLCFVA